MGDYDISHYVEVQIDALQEQITVLDARVAELEAADAPVLKEEVSYGQ